MHAEVDRMTTAEQKMDNLESQEISMNQDLDAGELGNGKFEDTWSIQTVIAIVYVLYDVTD